MKTLILHHLKKAKGQFLSFAVVMMITALILNSALVLLFQTFDAYDRLFDELNTAQISVAVASSSDDELRDELEKLNAVQAVDRHEALFAVAELQNFQGSSFSMNTYFYRLKDRRSLTRHEIVEEKEPCDDGSVYIPLYLSELGGYQTGESINYIIDGKAYTFTIQGIIGEMQYGNYGTGFIGLYLSDGAYERLQKENAFIPVGEYLIKTRENADLISVKSAVISLLRERNISVISILDSQTTKESRTMISSTVILFLAVFAGLVLCISVFLCRFRIKNNIEEEYGEMGVWKGIGYTGSMLRNCQIIPYLLICAVGLIGGVALSYALIPIIAHVLAVQSGFSYRPVFDLPAAFITVSFILFTVFVFTLQATKKIKRLEPIYAIRGIDPLKGGKKNHVLLDRAKGPIGFNLILKQACESPARNMFLFAMSFIMMILLSFTGILFYNVNVCPDRFLTTLTEELPDLQVQGKADSFDELKRLLQNEKVKAVNYGIAMSEYTGGSMATIVCEDFSLLENHIVYSGRHPNRSDEIAIGSAFADDYAIGDKFTLSINGRQYAYRVTGFIQSVNHNGLIAEITDYGYMELSDHPMASLNLYLADDEDVSRFVDKLNGPYQDYVSSVHHSAEEAQSMQTMYASLITIAAIILLAAALLITGLILYVILHSMIIGCKTDFGVYKALGFTGRQLIVQTISAITPSILAGALCSAIAGIWYLPILYQGIFSMIGAIKNNFEIPLYLLLFMASLFLIMSVLIGIMPCRPIKKIAAYSLIKE